MYTVEGRNLNAAQIRHLVFYIGTLGDENGTLPPPPTPRRNRRDNSGNEMEFMVPTPTLSNGTETECLETWDYMSEVDTHIPENTTNQAGN